MLLKCPPNRPDLLDCDTNQIPLDDLIEEIVYTHGPISPAQVAWALSTHFNRDHSPHSTAILMSRLNRFGRITRHGGHSGRRVTYTHAKAMP